MIEISYYFNIIEIYRKQYRNIAFFLKMGNEKGEKKKRNGKNLELKFFIFYELNMITIFVKKMSCCKK